MYFDLKVKEGTHLYLMTQGGKVEENRRELNKRPFNGIKRD
jgi:hypothetical protein